MRFAGELLGIDSREGLGDPGNLRELRRALRVDKVIPRSLATDAREFYAPAAHGMAPEHSEPGYSLRGGYQPEVAYGA